MLTRITSMVLALGFLLSAGAFAFDRPGALGPGGEVYLTQVGPYGVLFPKGKSYPANNVVLTLEVSWSGGAADRVMVPGTEGAEVEASPFVVFEETSKSLYLLWQTKSDALVNRLILRTFKDGSFGPPIEVRTSLFNAAMSAPQVAVTRDEFFVPTADGGTATVHRTLLHLIWWEESPAGNEVHYAPITLIEGIYTGWHPVYSLNDFDRSPDDSAAANEALAQLYRSPRIQTGRNDHSVVISFADERNGRLTVLDVSLLPGEISYIADKIRSHIIDIGRKKPTASEIADKIRSHIIDIGRLQPQVVSFLSNDVYQHILAVGPQFEGNGVPRDPPARRGRQHRRDRRSPASGAWSVQPAGAAHRGRADHRLRLGRRESRPGRLGCGQSDPLPGELGRRLGRRPRCDPEHRSHARAGLRVPGAAAPSLTGARPGILTASSDFSNRSINHRWRGPPPAAPPSDSHAGPGRPPPRPPRRSPSGVPAGRAEPDNHRRPRRTPSRPMPRAPGQPPTGAPAPASRHLRPSAGGSSIRAPSRSPPAGNLLLPGPRRARRRPRRSRRTARCSPARRPGGAGPPASSGPPRSG